MWKVLPKVKQGQTPPEIGADHCAAFLLGIAGTGTVGEAADAAKRYGGLQKKQESVRYLSRGKLPREAFTKLHADLVDIINEAREHVREHLDGGEIWDNRPHRMIFGHDPKEPFVEIEWKDDRCWQYGPSEHGYVLQPYYTHAAIFDGCIFEIFAWLLEGVEPR